MTRYNNIKIPVGLATQICNSKSTRKALETYFMLKRLSDKGWFHYNVKYLTSIETDLKICYKTIVKRLKFLQKLQLVTINKQHVTLANNNKLKQIFKTGNEYYLIKPELLEKVKLEDYFIALAIEEKKQSCSNAFYKKHLKLGLKNEIINGVFNGEKPKSSYKEAVTKAHLIDFIENGNNSDFSYAFNAARADVEVGYKKISNMLGYKGIGSLAYTKRKLQKQGIVTIYKREVHVSTTTHSTKLNRQTCLGTVNFDSRNKQLNLQLPDKIMLNTQTQIINHAKA